MFGACALVLFLAMAASLAIGSRVLSPAQVWQALTGSGTPIDTEVVVRMRVPRTIAGLVVGCALGLAGAVMQALTRNPLADPGILGVNAGAALGVVSACAATGVSTQARNATAALAGALAASCAVHLLAGRGGPGSRARLALAGIALTAALSSLTQAVVLADRFAFNEFRHWVSGSLEGVRFSSLAWAGAPLAVGAVIAALLGPALGALALGDEAAAGLGVRVRVVRTCGLVAVGALAGAATAICGPLGFVGLAVPLIARRLVGSGQSALSALSAVLGGAWVLIADVMARVLVPEEVPVGVVLALIGAPFFVALARGRGASA